MKILGGMSMMEWWTWLVPYRKFLLIGIWSLGVICVPVMKKIQPDSFWAYLAYVIIVELFFTVFALCLSALELAE